MSTGGAGKPLPTAVPAVSLSAADLLAGAGETTGAVCVVLVPTVAAFAAASGVTAVRAQPTVARGANPAEARAPDLVEEAGGEAVAEEVGEEVAAALGVTRAMAHGTTKTAATRVAATWRAIAI